MWDSMQTMLLCWVLIISMVHHIPQVPELPGTAAVGFPSLHVFDCPVALRPNAALRLEPGLNLHEVPPESTRGNQQQLRNPAATRALLHLGHGDSHRRSPPVKPPHISSRASSLGTRGTCHVEVLPTLRAAAFNTTQHWHPLCMDMMAASDPEQTVIQACCK